MSEQERKPDLDPAHELPIGVPKPPDQLGPIELLRRTDETTEQLGVAIQELKEAAMKDALTGLDNRRSFDEKMHELISRMTPPGGDVREGDIQHLTILTLDMDKFKTINDTYGHDVGDKALLTFVDHLKKTFPRAGDIIARVGGDEFQIIFVGAAEDDIFRKKFEKVEEDGEMFYRLPAIPPLEIEVEGKTISIPLSATGGVTGFTAGETIPDGLRRADKALYLAKENGRNRIEGTKSLPPDHRQRPEPEEPPELPVELL